MPKIKRLISDWILGILFRCLKIECLGKLTTGLKPTEWIGSYVAGKIVLSGFSCPLGYFGIV